MTRLPSPRRFAAVLALSLLAAAGRAPGQSAPQLTWTPGGSAGGGSGTWDTTTANWSNGASTVPWTDGDRALFAGAGGTVSISSFVTASQVTFSAPGYTVASFFLESAASGLTVQTDADATVSAAIFGPGGGSSAPFTKTGAGALTVAGSGPVFFGSVTVAAGELRYAGTSSPDFTTPYILANAPGAALTFASSFNNVASLAGGNPGGGGSGGVVRPNVTSGSLALSINDGGGATFGGIIQDNGGATLALQKSGFGTQTLTGANTYSGGTTVSGGALVLTGANTFKGVLNVNGSGTLALAGTNGSALNAASVNVTGGGTFRLDNSGAVNTDRLGNVPVNLSGGTFNLVGNAAADSKAGVGLLTVARAASVSVTPQGATAATLNLFGGLARQNNGTVGFTGGGNVVVTGLTNLNGIVGGYATVGADWAAVDAANRVFAYTGYTTDLTSFDDQNNVRLASAGGSTVAAARSQTHNSLNLVNTGGAGAAVLDIGAGQRFDISSGGLLTSGGAGHVIQNGTLTSSGGELIVTNQAALTVASAIADNGHPLTLTKSGAGTLVLTGTNTYTGPTVINQGIVQASADNNLGAGTAVAVNGGTLQATGSFTSAKSLQGTGGTVDTQGFSVAFNGGSNTGSFSKSGTGILALTEAVGSVTINAGTLRLTNLAVGDGASVTLSGGRLEASGSGVARVNAFGQSQEISPGAFGQPAALTLGTLLVSGFTTVDFDLGGSATDSLTITSFVSLSGGSNAQLLFRFGELGGTRPGTAYPVLNLPASAGFLSASSFALDPASVAAGYRGVFSVANNTVSVTFSAVPEPGAAAWLLGGLALAGWARRRFARR